MVRPGKSEYARLRRHAYVRRERRGLRSGCALWAFPLAFGLVSFVLVLALLGFANLVSPYMFWLDPEDQIRHPWIWVLKMSAALAGMMVGMYYAGWLFFYVLAPDVRNLPNKSKADAESE